MAKNQTGQERESAKAIYTRLESDRNPYTKRAERCAEYTIPSLFPKSSSGASTEFKTPYQALGARGVNNLTAKILLAIMPPNTSFFRLDVSAEEKGKLEKVQLPDVLSKVQYALSQREQVIMRYLETNQFRVTIGEGIKQLLIAGNYLFYLPPAEGGIKGYRLNNYVLERDGLGKVFTIVALDHLSFASLPVELQNLVSQKSPRKPSDKIEIYTHVYLEDGFYYSLQEVEGLVVPGSEQKYPEDKSPWIPIRMVKVDGEDYGRGYVEEQLGDLVSAEGLSKAIIEYSAVCSRIIYLVKPSGQTSARKVANAKTGDFITGRREDIEALTIDKYNDFQVAKATLDSLRSDLSLAFLLNSAVQRNAERVTAEEIKYVARELEDTLGGIYSILSQELQLPLVRRIIVQLQSMGFLEEFPKGSIEPSITTGLEALGRGHDLDKLNQFLQYLTQIPGATEYMNVGGLLQTVATSLSINMNGLVRTDEEVQQMRQEQAQQAMAQQVIPQVTQGAVDSAKNGDSQ